MNWCPDYQATFVTFNWLDRRDGFGNAEVHNLDGPAPPAGHHDVVGPNAVHDAELVGGLSASAGGSRSRATGNAPAR
jgi:hypothetical protein